MVTICAVLGCKERQKKESHITFHRIPSRTKNRHSALSLQRKIEWLRSLRRKDLQNRSTSNLYVCSKHFVGGKCASLTDRNSASWVPTINMGYDTTDRDRRRQFMNVPQLIIRRKVQKTITSNDTEMESYQQVQIPTTSNDTEMASYKQGVQKTTSHDTEMTSYQQEEKPNINALFQEIAYQQEEKPNINALLQEIAYQQEEKPNINALLQEIASLKQKNEIQAKKMSEFHVKIRTLLRENLNLKEKLRI